MINTEMGCKLQTKVNAGVQRRELPLLSCLVGSHPSFRFVISLKYELCRCHSKSIVALVAEFLAVFFAHLLSREEGSDCGDA